MCYPSSPGDGKTPGDGKQWNASFPHTFTYYFKSYTLFVLLVVAVSSLTDVSLVGLPTVFCQVDTRCKWCEAHTLSKKSWNMPSLFYCNWPMASVCWAAALLGMPTNSLPRQSILPLHWDQQPAYNKKLWCCTELFGPASSCQWPQEAKMKENCPRQWQAQCLSVLLATETSGSSHQ